MIGQGVITKLGKKTRSSTKKKVISKKSPRTGGGLLSHNIRFYKKSRTNFFSSLKESFKNIVVDVHQPMRSTIARFAWLPPPIYNNQRAR
jgi:hypothetical protein